MSDKKKTAPEKQITASILLPESKIESLRKIAQIEGRSLSKCIGRMIDESLDYRSAAQKE